MFKFVFIAGVERAGETSLMNHLEARNPKRIYFRKKVFSVGMEFMDVSRAVLVPRPIYFCVVA